MTENACASVCHDTPACAGIDYDHNRGRCYFNDGHCAHKSMELTSATGSNFWRRHLCLHERCGTDASSHHFAVSGAPFTALNTGSLNTYDGKFTAGGQCWARTYTDGNWRANWNGCRFEIEAGKAVVDALARCVNNDAAADVLLGKAGVSDFCAELQAHHSYSGCSDPIVQKVCPQSCPPADPIEYCGKDSNPAADSHWSKTCSNAAADPGIFGNEFGLLQTFCPEATATEVRRQAGKFRLLKYDKCNNCNDNQ